MRWFPVIVMAALALPGPAHAKVTFDFATNTGFVDAEDVRQAFDWDAATLRARAKGLEFEHVKLVQDVYAVVCARAGARPVRAVHTAQDAKEFLTVTVVRAAGTRKITGFRIVKAYAGISGTTVPPTPGTPCPEPKPDDQVRTSRLVSTTVTTTLVAKSGPDRVELYQIRTGPPVPAAAQPALATVQAALSTAQAAQSTAQAAPSAAQPALSTAQPALSTAQPAQSAAPPVPAAAVSRPDQASAVSRTA
ncbi:hypothetical protein [Actinoplanes flavus]|uniref:Uncharacterized protein n=1 Tax=Actinoplanes flavus TaxID=2820290 RepID=A0ABS3UE43_9ACTN|nr:hypothetical protein [Actinoplanes flavus]MBO3737047.1 hypothetical protein [Actinoplanes flavus]